MKLPKRKTKINSKVPKVVLTTILGLGITVGSVTANSNPDNLPRVYHVYIDGEHLGTVGSKDVVETYLNEKIVNQEHNLEENFNDVHLTVSQNIMYIPEVTYQPVFNNEQVLTNIEDKIDYSVEAVKLEVDGQLIGYFNDRETAQEVLNKFMAKYLSEEDIDQFNASLFKTEATEEESDAENENAEIATLAVETEEDQQKSNLSVGESTILDVALSEKVSLSEEKISFDELFSAEQGLKMLERGTIADQIHKIQSGEVLTSIASKYDLSMTELLSMNKDLQEDSILQIGQEVNVTGYKPILDVVVIEEELVAEEIDYQVKYESTDSLFKGQTKVKQNGQEGTKNVLYRLTKENGQVVEREVIESNVVKEPVDKIILQGTKVIPSRGTGDFAWPTAGGSITSKLGYRWGSYHKGIDIAGVSNRSIYAADNGTVVSAGWNGGYGNQVIINHNNGYRTSYSHLSSINVRVGQTVQRGQSIGVMGTTGNSTGVHLHFELYKNGMLQNPLNYY
jgi:murein DD-endopeptidase MepM/ murein hydrolase activator NlpD